MKNSVSVIIEARMSSRRLPGKVIKKIYNKEILKIIIQRIKLSKKIENFVVATTNNKKDNRLVSFLRKNKIPYYRGSSSNVLQRIIDCADKFKINNVLRVTGDNPLTDYLLIDEMINYFLKNRKYDFITNNYFANKKKRRLAYGLDLSLFSINSLKKVKKFAGKNKVFQEYPTLYYHTKGKSKFKIKNILHNKSYILDNRYRLTVDTKEDLIFFNFLFKEYFNHYTKDNYIYLSKLKKIIKKNPSLIKINKEIVHYVPKLIS